MARNSKGIGVAAAILAAIALSLLAMLALLNRRDQRLGLNQEIHIDDFGFSVLSVRQTDAIGTGEHASKPRGTYYIVAMKISNHAKRVNYKFKRSSAVLVDDAGRQYLFSREGQDALESPSRLAACDAPIPAGASCTTDIVFDLPGEARLSHLRMSFGGLIGDLLDRVFLGNRVIELGSGAIQTGTKEQTEHERERVYGHKP